MKVLVVSEGQHELGADLRQGALIELTRRMMNQNADFVPEYVSSSKVRIHRPRGKSAAYEKRALGWIRYAQNQGFNALVFLIDQDGQQERVTGIENAQNHNDFALKRAMGVAIRKFDAWMLSDEVALSQVLGINVQRQQDPESLKDPKGLCEQLRDKAGSELSLTELYFQIVDILDLSRLTERCPRGFAPFRSRLENLFSE